MCSTSLAYLAVCIVTTLPGARCWPVWSTTTASEQRRGTVPSSGKGGHQYKSNWFLQCHFYNVTYVGSELVNNVFLGVNFWTFSIVKYGRTFILVLLIHTNKEKVDKFHILKKEDFRGWLKLTHFL